MRPTNIHKTERKPNNHRQECQKSLSRLPGTRGRNPAITARDANRTLAGGEYPAKAHKPRNRLQEQPQGQPINTATASRLPDLFLAREGELLADKPTYQDYVGALRFITDTTHP